ncbi:MAG TPA: glycosyltransferase family 4 protein [Solirubrobacteraceae bacterium]|nr:glycosyltransferase family 4 protein [Solirubrobacteraceae bacterium]
MPEPPAPGLPLGVNLAGYLDATVGLGEAARHVATALEGAGVAVARVGLSSRGAPRSQAGALTQPAQHPITLVCANPDAMTGARDELGAGAFEGRHVIGMWWWEVAAVHGRCMRAFDLVDEVWAGSRFVADVFAAVAPVPVVHVPMPVPEPIISAAGRDTLGLPRHGFLFGLVYDYASIAARKNPLGLIEAFARAFGDEEEEVGLVLKTLGGERWPAEHAAVMAAAGAHPNVTVIDAHLPTEDKNALIRELDCYVSLHRSEGFGLTIAEAMLLETPVIATDYGGSRDFVTAFNALLVDARMVPVGPGNDPYPADGEWAEPDLDHAAACMRTVLADRVGAQGRAKRARAEVVAHHAPAVAGRAMAERLARVMRLPLDGSGRSSALDLGAVRARMATGPKAGPGGERGARGAAREAVLRAMRPYTVHQRLVDEEILRVLQTLDERVQGLAAGQQALAAQLARLRDEHRDEHRAQ